jgi:hypothetical protein
MQVNFHTTMSGQAMVTMIYHRKLDAEWTAAAQRLRRVLGACPSSSLPVVHIIGRSRKQKIELDASHVMETLTVEGRKLTYKQVRLQLCYKPDAPEPCAMLSSLAPRMQQPFCSLSCIQTPMTNAVYEQHIEALQALHFAGN